MGTFVRRVDEVSAMVFVPLVLAEPLLGPIAVPWNERENFSEIGSDRKRILRRSTETGISGINLFVISTKALLSMKRFGDGKPRIRKEAYLD